MRFSHATSLLNIPTPPKNRKMVHCCTYRLSTLKGRESLLRICLVCSVRRIRDRGSGYVHQTDAEAMRSYRLLSQPDPFACRGLPPESPCLSPRGRIARDGPQNSTHTRTRRRGLGLPRSIWRNTTRCRRVWHGLGLWRRCERVSKSTWIWRRCGKSILPASFLELRPQTKKTA